MDETALFEEYAPLWRQLTMYSERIAAAMAPSSLHVATDEDDGGDNSIPPARSDGQAVNIAAAHRLLNSWGFPWSEPHDPVGDARMDSLPLHSGGRRAESTTTTTSALSSDVVATVSALTEAAATCVVDFLAAVDLSCCTVESMTAADVANGGGFAGGRETARGSSVAHHASTAGKLIDDGDGDGDGGRGGDASEEVTGVPGLAAHQSTLTTHVLSASAGAASDPDAMILRPNSPRDYSLFLNFVQAASFVFPVILSDIRVTEPADLLPGTLSSGAPGGAPAVDPPPLSPDVELAPGSFASTAGLADDASFTTGRSLTHGDLGGSTDVAATPRRRRVKGKEGATAAVCLLGAALHDRGGASLVVSSVLDMTRAVAIATSLQSIARRYPHVSGLFPLFTCLARLLDADRMLEKSVERIAAVSATYPPPPSASRHESDAALAKVRVFARQALQRIPDYSQELLLACVSFLLRCSSEALPTAATALPLQVAFEHGADSLPLLRLGIGALDRMLTSLTRATLDYQQPGSAFVGLLGLDVDGGKQGSSTGIALFASPDPSDTFLNTCSPGEARRLRLLRECHAVVMRVLPMVRRVFAGLVASRAANSSSAAPAQKLILDLITEHSLLLAALQQHSAWSASGRDGAVGSDAAEFTVSGGAAKAAASSGVDVEQMVSRLSKLLNPAMPILSVKLPFKDQTLTVDFDGVLPKVVLVCLSSTHRRARMAAGEWLHAVVVYVVGTLAFRAASDGVAAAGAPSHPFAPLLAELLPVVVALSASIDAVTQKLFMTLSLQLARWFAQQSSRSGGGGAAAYLDAIIAALANPSSSLRTAATECLSVYVGKAVALLVGTKQQAPTQGGLRLGGPSAAQQSLLASVRVVFKRLLPLLTQSSEPRGRLGVAVALHRIAFSVARVEELVCEHAMETLYQLYQALAACDAALRLSSVGLDTLMSGERTTDGFGRGGGGEPGIEGGAEDAVGATSLPTVAVLQAAMEALENAVNRYEVMIVVGASVLQTRPSAAAAAALDGLVTRGLHPGGTAAVPMTPSLIAAASYRSGSSVESLNDLVEFFFEQSGAVDARSRHVAMRLFVSLCSSLTGFDSDDGPRRWLAACHLKRGESFFEGLFKHGFASSTGSVAEHSQLPATISRPQAGEIPSAHSGMELFFRRLLRHPRAAESDCVLSLPKYLSWARELQASVDCHVWLISSGLLPPHYAFGSRSASATGGAATFLKTPHGRTTASASPRPRSQLLRHVAAFVEHITSAGPVGVPASTQALLDSQVTWVHAGTAQPATAPPAVSFQNSAPTSGIVGASPTSFRLHNGGDGITESMAIARVQVLEALDALVSLLVTRFPSCAWTDWDADIVVAKAARRGASSAAAITDAQRLLAPILSETIIDLLCRSLLRPWDIVGAAAVVEEQHPLTTLSSDMTGIQRIKTFR